MTLYHVSYEASKRNGRGIGLGMRHVVAASPAEAVAITVAEVRASFGAPRLTVRANAKLPAPQCPACAHWHEPAIADGAACCGCRA